MLTLALLWLISGTLSGVLVAHLTSKDNWDVLERSLVVGGSLLLGPVVIIMSILWFGGYLLCFLFEHYDKMFE